MHNPATLSRLHISHINPALRRPGQQGNKSRQEIGPAEQSDPSYLSVNTSEGMFLLRQEEITRCEADGNYCIIHYSNKQKLLCSKTLKCIENHLPASVYFRVHQSHLVRITEIRLIQSDQVVLMNDVKLPLSRQQRPGLINRINLFATKI